MNTYTFTDKQWEALYEVAQREWEHWQDFADSVYETQEDRAEFARKAKLWEDIWEQLTTK